MNSWFSTKIFYLNVSECVQQYKSLNSTAVCMSLSKFVKYLLVKNYECKYISNFAVTTKLLISA